MKRPFNPLKIPVLLIIGLIKISFAYIGPGTGLSALGALLAVLVGVAATIFGLLWYPITRLFGKRKKTQEPDPDTDEKE